MARDEHNTRRLLLDLGIGDYNATMVLPYMFMAPAQTDPAMAQVQLLTNAMRMNMRAMGATWVAQRGAIDDSMAFCLHALVGPHWNEITWGELVNALLIARRKGQRFSRAYGIGPQTVELGGMGFLPDLPDVPGGLLTYGLVGFLLYRHFTKKGA